MNEKFKDVTLSATERADDLIGRMSLEEKIRQITCKQVIGAQPGAEDDVEFCNGIGHVGVFSSRNTPKEEAEMIRKIQEKVIKSSRFGIPAIVHAEALSGLCITGAVQYPTSISLGATFEPDIVLDMGKRIRRQMVAVGIRQALSPVLDIIRDLRWGRVNESYGNDPTLVSAMACAFVEGIQGEDYREGVAATAKHFLGYSATEGGVNMAQTMLSERDLREVYAKPFEAAIRKSGLLSVMNSYSELNGEPICASKKVLNDLLRDELGFKGVTVSDYTSIERLVHNFHTAKDMQDAACQCLKAGLDVELPNPNGYNENLIDAVAKGMLEESDIDHACKRILELKFELGLFEQPYPLAREQIEMAFDRMENDRANLQATRKVVTLTKNDGILPLIEKDIKVAVIGPTGNTLRKMYGCYTNVATIELLMHSIEAMAGMGKDKMDAGERDTATVMAGRQEYPEKIEPVVRQLHPDAKTIFEAVKEHFPHTEYVEGCDYKDLADTNFAEAVLAAEKADLVIMTVGGKNGWGPHCTSGEGMDTANFGLPGNQEQLLKAVGAINKNFIVIHTDSRPLVSSYAYKNARAIIEGWYAGTYAGQVMAETLVGEINPGGRLQQDVPSANGALTYHYQQNASHYKTIENLGSLGYTDLPDGLLLRPFGYGLSYTSFTYENIRFNVTGDEMPVVIVEADVKNTGSVAGDEVIQLYGKDVVGSIVRPYHQLIGFKRVTLKPGEKKCVRFSFRLDALAFRDKNGDWICEAGDYKFFIAANAEDESNCISYYLSETVKVNPELRDFFAFAEVLA